MTESRPEAAIRIDRRHFLGRFGVIAGASAMAGATAGCAMSANGPGQQTLQILGQTSEIDQPTIKAFEAENPGVSVSLTEYSWDMALTMLAAGTPPDLMRGAGATDTPFLASRNLALPLDDLLASSKVISLDDLDPINDLWRYDGSTQGRGPLHGLVKDYSSDLTLWVNNSALPDEARAMTSGTAPMSYAEVLSAAKRSNKIVKGRTKTLGFGCFFGNKPDFSWLQAMLAQAGENIFTADMSAIDLSSDAAVEAISFFVELVRSKVSASFLAPQASTDTDLYVADRMALLLSGYWTTGMIAAAPKSLQASSQLLPAPQLGSDRISPCVAGTGMWIPRKAKYPELAWKFMEFYFGQKPALDRARSGWGVPSLKSLRAEVPRSTPLQRQAWQVQQGEQQYFKILPFTPYAQVDTLSAAILAAFTERLKAGAPVKEICAACAAATNKVVTRGRS